jgi:hypothetical protein
MPDIWFNFSDSKSLGQASYNDISTFYVSAGITLKDEDKLYIIGHDHSETVLNSNYVSINGSIFNIALSNINNNLTMLDINYPFINASAQLCTYTYNSNNAYSFQAVKVAFWSYEYEITEILDVASYNLLYLNINYNILTFNDEHLGLVGSMDSSGSYSSYIRNLYTDASVIDSNIIFGDLLNSYGSYDAGDEISQTSTKELTEAYNAYDTDAIYDYAADSYIGNESDTIVYDSGEVSDYSYSNFGDQLSLLRKMGVDANTTYTYTYKLGDDKLDCTVIIDAFGIIFNAPNVQ